MTITEAIKCLGPKIKERTLIPFCGAGISVPSGLPVVKDFLDKFGFCKLSFPSAMSILQYDPQFKRLFNQTFGAAYLTHNILHELITQLDAKYYITTNYDRLLEDAFGKRHGENFSRKLKIIRKDDEIPNVNFYQNVLIKFHGDINITNLLVFTKEHYFYRLKNPCLVDGFVRFLFATYTILFVGYSLQDDNVYEILHKENLLDAPDLPDKYIVLPKQSDEIERYLKLLNVIPIYLECNPDKITEKLTEFLYQLWEQLDCYSNLTNMLEISKELPIEESIQRAISLRRENETEKAKEVLNEIINRPGINWAQYLNIIPNILWLYVSIYDKLEEWKDLRIIENNRIIALLNDLSRNLPENIFKTIFCTYQGSMAIAMLRSFDLDEANQRYEKSESLYLTESSPLSLQIYKANIYAIGAIIKYSFYIRDNKKGLLNLAINDLNKAKKLFSGSDSECHHIGRFYGISAFIGTSKTNPDKKNILENSKLSHHGKNRTHYGKIAGKYCDAYCHFWVAMRDKEGKKTEYLNNARELLEYCEENLKENQFIARVKVFGLMIEILKELRLPSLGDDYQKKYNEAFSSLDASYKEKIKILGVNNWLKIPLN